MEFADAFIFVNYDVMGQEWDLFFSTNVVSRKKIIIINVFCV